MSAVCDCMCDHCRDLERDAAERERELKQALSDAIDVAVWMSGSSSFSPEGEAHEGWLKARPKLFAAMNVLGQEPVAAAAVVSRTGDEQ